MGLARKRERGEREMGERERVCDREREKKRMREGGEREIGLRNRWVPGGEKSIGE